MDLSFDIPMNQSDLLNHTREKIHVQVTYNADQIPKLLNDIKSSLSTGVNSLLIYDHFDSFFAILDNAARVNTLNLFRAYDLIYHILEKLQNDLAPHLANNDVPRETRIKYLNATKMIMYLLCSIVKTIDKSVYNYDSGGIASGKNKKKNDFDETSTQWDTKRLRCLVQLYHFLSQLPLPKLWDPPIVEENFTNLFCDLCYRTLEQQLVKTKAGGDTIFQILGVAVKQYNHAMTLPIKLLHLIKSYEHSSIPIADGIHLLNEEFGISTIFSILIKEIVDELSVDSADSQTSKNFGLFLSELNVVSSKIMIPHLTSLSDELLNNQSYALRICILKMMSDAILKDLTSEELTDEMKIIRDDFLEKLFDHMMDVNSHVRSKVLNIFYQLKEAHAVPLTYQHKILEIAIDRLDDKSSMVRKNAIILIKTFLERNPFSAKLTEKELTDKYELESNKLEELHSKLVESNKQVHELEEKFEKEISPELDALLDKMRENQYQIDEMNLILGGSKDIPIKIKELLLAGSYINAIKLIQLIDIQAEQMDKIDQLEGDVYKKYYKFHLQNYYTSDNDVKLMSEEFSKQEKITQFLHDSLNFSKSLKSALPKLEEFLLSKTNSDVIEAISFFTTGYLFGIEGTEVGMIKSLNLVWSGDKEKRESVINAYNRIFFSTDTGGRLHALKVVENLSNFFNFLTKGFYKAFGILIKEWIETGVIENTIIQVLFEKFTMKIENTSDDDARKALQILVLASRASNSVAQANVPILQDYGLLDFGMRDPRVYSSVLDLLLNLVHQKDDSKFKRFLPSDQLVLTVKETYVRLYFGSHSFKNFDPITATVFDFIYHVSQSPDKVTEEILYEILQKVEKKSDNWLTEDEKKNNDGEEILKLPAWLMIRTIYLIGYVAMKEMIFLDMDVYSNTKYRHELHRGREKKLLDRHRKAMNASASNAMKRLSNQGKEPNEEEVSQGAEADDRIAEAINYVCEKVLLFSDDVIFHNFVTPIFEIFKYPGRYQDDCYIAAVSAILRFMFVSADYCESNMPFIMVVLHESSNRKIKINIMIGITDLMFRFPNIIGSWTEQFYSTLYDKDDEVRLIVVKMLSHLIIQEMIRVKGQISDLALCIVDAHDEIRITTQQLFKEIATKPNTLYNVLPDIIARLGDPNINLEEEKYRAIMRFIFGLIEKNRQSESLVDKLCFRFKITKLEREWRDIVFCLELITHTEKTIRKLIDHIPLYKDKVQIDEVYNGFKQIIANTTKLSKQEGAIKEIITEFETKLEECLQIREPNETNNDGNTPSSNEEIGPADSSANLMKKPTRPAPRKSGRGANKKLTQSTAKGKRKPTKSRNQYESDDDEEEDEEEDVDEEKGNGHNISDDSDSTDSNEPPNKKLGSNNKSRNTAVSDSSSDEDLIRPRTNTRRASARGNTKKAAKKK